MNLASPRVASSPFTIEARGLSKRFRVPLKAPGLVGALKHLARPRYQEKIAVDGIDFAGLVVAGVASVVWKEGLRRYQGTGS